MKRGLFLWENLKEGAQENVKWVREDIMSTEQETGSFGRASGRFF